MSDKWTLHLTESISRYNNFNRVFVSFQAAQPNPQWPGVFDAFNGHIRCTQRLLGMVVGEEDCLVLNVYTPLPKKDTLLPVMVFIHGGGFRDGSGAPVLYGPNYLIKKDVILVTLNYRVEILGFLCLGIEEAPGNAGLKDQQEALKWIKKNIRAFGGDLDKITIFGESAGSASVMYHLLSSLSEGLFNRAIMQSGSATAPWAFQFEPLKAASLLAKELGYETKNPKEIYNLFMKTTARDLMTMRVPRKKGDIVLSENVFVPCIDKELPGVNRFINDTPYNLLARGDYTKVPVIIGFNNEEGLMFFGKENDTTISEIDFYKALPRNLVFPTEKEAKATAAKLNGTYIGNKEDDITIKLSRFEGDSGITYPVISATQLLLNTNDNPIYIYKFPYSGLLNVAKFFSGFTHVSGASHADDLFYLFKTAIFLPTSLLETKMINKMTSMWTNFAKTG